MRSRLDGELEGQRRQERVMDGGQDRCREGQRREEVRRDCNKTPTSIAEGNTTIDKQECNPCTTLKRANSINICTISRSEQGRETQTSNISDCVCLLWHHLGVKSQNNTGTNLSLNDNKTLCAAEELG